MAVPCRKGSALSMYWGLYPILNGVDDGNMWLAIGKELDQEGLSDVLANRRKSRRGFVIDEDVFLKMSCDIETYVRLLSLIGSGRLRVRTNANAKRRHTGSVGVYSRNEGERGAGSERSDAAIAEGLCDGAIEPDGRMSEKFCPKCYLFRTSEESFCTTCGTKLKEMKLNHGKG